MKSYLLLLALILSTTLFAQNFVDTSYSIATETNIEYGNSVNFAGVQKTLEMDISYPTDDIVPSCGRPLALIIHGGAWLAGNKNEGYIPGIRRDFAKRGYVAVAINYRLGFFQTDVSKNCNIDGWNCLNAADSLEWIRAWYRGVQDAKGALRYMINHQDDYDIDPSNVFVIGESAGAYIAMGVGFMDVEDEKPIGCGAVSSVSAPHQDYYLPCIEDSQYDMNINDMDLSRPDLGSIHGNLNPTSLPYNIKGVASLYGGLYQDLFSKKAYFDTPRLYMFHQPNDLIVPINYDLLLKGLNTCAMNTGCVNIQNRKYSYGSQAIDNMIDTLSISPVWKPEVRYETTTNTADCVLQFLDSETYAGHKLDNYWTRTVSIADFFAEDIGPNDCATLSLDNLNTISNIDIYPNPTNDQLFISHNTTEVNIYLFDTQGKILEKQSGVTSGSSISIGDLNNGVYYLKVSSDTQNTTHKIIKSDK